MKYENTVKGKFISRPNRFIAIVEIDGVKEVCHVKNTGRCKELLIPGVTVILEKSSNEKRKTKYDVLAVYKGDKLINIDSSAPNKVFFEYLKKQPGITKIKPEAKYKSSRFDFYIERGAEKVFIETKGVTLEENDIFMFPDAPTERGVKHINELIDAKENGYTSQIVFIIQADYGMYFTPNEKTHKAFAEALKEADRKGVEIYCFCCYVNENEILIKGEMEYRV